jgi:ParB family transcriptional regulator, chromosome partitioning protein
MSKRKRFGISPELNQGFTDAVSVVEHYSGDAGGRFAVVSLRRIECDPENPRELSITESDFPPKRISASDPKANQKKKELEDLSFMADTIKSQGVLQPIIIYKHADKYRIIAGERRYLASTLAGQTDIQAIVYDKKPPAFKLRRLQWIENNTREGLSLKDRVRNIQQILDEYRHLHPAEKLTATKLSALINVSNTIGRRYFNVLNAPADLRDAVLAGRIQSLKTANFISTIAAQEQRKRLITEAEQGSNLGQLKAIASALNKKTDKTVKSRGRSYTRVNLGHTKKTAVVKTLVNAVLSMPDFAEMKTQFQAINWADFDAANRAFKSLVQILEKRAS